MILATCLLAAACATGAASRPVAAGDCAPVTDHLPTRGWRTNCPEAVALDTAVLRRGMEYLARYPASVSMLVARRGYLVVERYFGRGAEAHTAFDVGSITKTVVGALVGVAVHEGRLPPLDAPYLDCFDAASRDSTLDPWRAVTMHHLLTMRAGYENDGAGVAGDGTMAGLLRRPLVAPPGTRAAYDHGSYHLVGACLRTKVDGTLVRYARDRIFGPMGEELDYLNWDSDDDDIEWGHAGLVLRPRALAKFGQLYARSGNWGERSLVPTAWVEATTATAGEGADVELATFAFGWWRRTMAGTRVLYAEGAGGQLLAIFPELDLLVVVTGDPRIPGALARPERFLESYVLAAVRDRVAAPSR